MSKARARELRRDAPFAERLVWSRLRNRQLDGWKFRRQHPVGYYFTDFACVEAKLIVELDGDTHSAPDQQARDARRTEFLESEGWCVMRIYNADVFENLDGVMDMILDALRFRAASQSTPLPLAGEEGPAPAGRGR